ncbi:mediator of RNA polymerase II transcription subunit 15a-like [Hevea brasiliensis]|uniref:mediator of RNA polymerase II transcription subunit 15a-like n=1 Tax=Hevea brasiliensis TaxID=3981 RepID=UPI0025F39D0B|nr:mediator of RNA polymerase II transcription subunit 15a-like [Hevea brasiliensis]
MDSSKSRYTAPGGELDIDMRDWRVHVKHEGRQRIVNKITETLNGCLPLSSDEGLLELKNIATRFEEKIYVSATTQSDYLRKISSKILTLEKKAEK